MDIDLSTIEVMNAEAADSERAADGRADCGGQARLLGAGWTSALFAQGLFLVRFHKTLVQSYW